MLNNQIKPAYLNSQIGVAFFSKTHKHTNTLVFDMGGRGVATPEMGVSGDFLVSMSKHTIERHG